MLKSEIKVGTEYAFREKRIPSTPFQRVRIIEHLRGNKWKAEWIEPNPGLVHYVESGQLIVQWKEHKAFLKDETNAERLREHNVSHGFERDSPLDRALEQVFESVGEEIQYSRGLLTGRPEADVRRGERHVLHLLNEYRPSWALLRQWAGHDAAVAQRETEIQRLERLVWDAIYALQKAGLDNEATKLRRAISGRT